MLERISQFIRLLITKCSPNLRSEIKELQSRLEVSRESILSLQLQNQSLIETHRVLEETLQYERTRAERNEEIYQKRLGIIMPQVVSNTQPQPVRTHVSMEELKRRLTKEHRTKTDPDLDARRKMWEERVSNARVPS